MGDEFEVVVQGTATFKDPQTITVDGKEIKGKRFILATGSEPTPLPFLKFDEKKLSPQQVLLTSKRFLKKKKRLGIKKKSL